AGRMAYKVAVRSKAKKESQLPPAGPLSSRVSSSTSSLQNAQSVTYRMHVDEKASIEQLLQIGQTGTTSRYERNRPAQKFAQLPAFNQPQNRQRGSSAGHSPQGSSDDNFSHSRNTLSPGGMGPITYGTAPAIMPRHMKQASAPELNHHALEVNNAFSPHTPLHQHTASLHAPSATRPVQIPQQPNQMSFGSKSVSAIDQQFAFDGPAAPPMQSNHNRSTSYDVTHASHYNQGFGGYPSQQQAHSHQELYGMGIAAQQQQPQQVQQVQQQLPKEKSQSMDPIIVNSVQQQQQQRFETPSEIDMSLPPNWSIGHTEQGEIFFIDHSNQTTTWYDPRIPHHLQEERIRMQHGIQAAADSAAAAAAHAAQVLAQQQAAQQAQQQQQQHHFGMGGQVPQQQPPQMLDQSSDARIQSLQSEVDALHERQRQLQQQGFLGSPQAMPYDHGVNNNLTSMEQQQYYQQQQQQRPPSMPAYQQDEPMEYTSSYVTPVHMMNRYNVDNFNSEELNQYLGEMQM
ncbi:hypothetical protein PFISCL1PPCAC_23182, partial [Pristionchus fissidentatus]